MSTIRRKKLIAAVTCLTELQGVSRAEAYGQLSRRAPALFNRLTSVKPPPWIRQDLECSPDVLEEYAAGQRAKNEPHRNRVWKVNPAQFMKAVGEKFAAKMRTFFRQGMTFEQAWERIGKDDPELMSQYMEYADWKERCR